MAQSAIAFHVNRAETGDKLHAYFPYTKDNSSNDAKNVALSIAAVQSQSKPAHSTSRTCQWSPIRKDSTPSPL